MNGLELKKRAFMKLASENGGLKSKKSGSIPLKLENCAAANMINYRIYGSCSDKISVKISGKNLLESFAELRNSSDYDTPILFEAGKKYTFSFESSTTSKWRLLIYGTDVDGTPFTAHSSDNNTTNRYLTGMYTGNTLYIQDGATRTTKSATYECKKSFIGTRICFINTDNGADDEFVGAQFEEGEEQTDFENFKKQRTVEIRLPKSLEKGEYVDFKSGEAVYSSGAVKVDLPTVALGEGTNILDCEAEVMPEKVETEFFVRIDVI